MTVLEKKIRRPFGVPVHALSTGEFLDTLLDRAKQDKQSFLITYLNAHCINTCFKDENYARIIEQADLVYADGQAVVWASRILNQPLPERVNAGDFFTRFCRECVKEGLSLYFLGSQKGVASKAAEKMKSRAPGLNVVGFHHGFFDESEAGQIVSGINMARPSILLVGMGVPHQEKFAARYLKELGAPVVWCVGALFEYYADVRPRAPLWMRRLGMEWLFRLVVEPRRMWRRYLLGNPAFLVKLIKYRFFK